MKDKEKDIIDFGEWKVPKAWDDITLKQYQDIERFYEDKEKNVDIREIIHILCNKTIDEVNALPATFLDILLEKLTFLQEQPKQEEATNKIKIDGEEYSVNIMEKLKTGEYVAFDTVLKNDKHNYAAMLAILCRKPGEIYDSKFEAEVYENRVKMFEKQPVINILPIVGFFLQLWVTLGKHSAMYSQVEEAINHTARQLKTSKNLGVFRRWYLTLRILKLKRSLKSISNTSQTSSHSLRFLHKKAKQMKRKRNSKRH
jgi:hypothetical protein